MRWKGFDVEAGEIAFGGVEKGVQRRAFRVGLPRAALLALCFLVLVGCSDVVGPTGGVEGVGFDPEPPATMNVEDVEVLHPVPLDSGGEELDITCTTEFESNDPSVVTVNSQGVLTAVAPGEAVITTRLNGVPGEVSIVVEEPEEGDPDDDDDPDPERLELEAEDVEFEAEEGGESPSPQSVAVTSRTDDEVEGLEWTSSYQDGAEGWLSGSMEDSETPTELELEADVEGVEAGEHVAELTVTGDEAEPATLTVTLVVEDVDAQIVGLEAEIGGHVPELDRLTDDEAEEDEGVDGVLSLDFQELLEDPVLDLTVWALMSDGTREDVTQAAVVDSDSPDLEVDTPGVLNLANLLVSALTDPEHYLNAEYEGFETQVELHLDVPALSELPLLDLELIGVDPDTELEVGSALPDLLAVVDDGLGGTAELEIPAGHGEVDWEIEGQEVSGALAPVVNPLLATLGNLVGGAIEITDGVISSLDLTILDEVLSLLGGTLTVDVVGFVDDLASDVLPMEISE